MVVGRKNGNDYRGGCANISFTAYGPPGSGAYRKSRSITSCHSSHNLNQLRLFTQDHPSDYLHSFKNTRILYSAYNCYTVFLFCMMQTLPISALIALPLVLLFLVFTLSIGWLSMRRNVLNRTEHSIQTSNKRFSGSSDDRGWRAPTSDDASQLQHYYMTEPETPMMSIATPPPAYASQMNSPSTEYRFPPPGSSLWADASSRFSLDKESRCVTPSSAHTITARRPPCQLEIETLREPSPTISLRTSFGFSTTRPQSLRIATPLTGDADPEDSDTQLTFSTPRTRRVNRKSAWLASIPNAAFDRMRAEHDTTNACVLDPTSVSISPSPPAHSTQGNIDSLDTPKGITNSKRHGQYGVTIPVYIV
jgi:hypothetical protein